MNEKIFTVIICAYNAENRLSRVIESVIKQQKYNDLVDKFLLIDNNSTDNTAEIMKSYESKMHNIQYVFEQVQGLSYARLAGVNNTNSEWIVFIDDDNILEENWIIKAYKYITDNDNIGAFNGSVVPLIEFNISKEEQTRLEVVYPSLACTNLQVEDIKFDLAVHPYETPFGAGLVIKAEPLKKLALRGWLKSKGRTGKLLISGEDTEMCLFIAKENYSFGYEPSMIIKHIIPKGRLEEKYLINLYKGFSENYYKSITDNNFCVIRRMKRVISLMIKIVIKSIMIAKTKDYKRKIELKLVVEYYKVIIKRTYEDGIF